MSRFYGTLGTRRGSERTATNPVHATLNGWDCGVQVQAQDVNGLDAFVIYATGGSNHNTPLVQLGVVYGSADGPYFVAGDGS